MRHWRWRSKALFAILVAAFAYYVWPTPWRYFSDESYRGGSGGVCNIRVHRVTGRAQILVRGGWRPYERSAPASSSRS